MLCIIINMVLLLSLLIAMLTKTYDTVNSRAALYFAKERLSTPRRLHPRFGAFLSLDFPFSVFPGSLILLLLGCLPSRCAAPLNRGLMRAPAYALTWITIATAAFLLNLLAAPLVWVLLLYNEVKLIMEPPAPPPNVKCKHNLRLAPKIIHAEKGFLPTPAPDPEYQAYPKERTFSTKGLLSPPPTPPTPSTLTPPPTPPTPTPAPAPPTPTPT